jgi:hypothetical protein
VQKHVGFVRIGHIGHIWFPVLRVFLSLIFEWTPRAKRGTATSKTETLLVWSCLHRHHMAS